MLNIHGRRIRDVFRAMPARANEDSLHAKIVNRMKRELIAQVMTLYDNVQTKAASRLGINRNTLHKKLKEYGLEEAGE